MSADVAQIGVDASAMPRRKPPGARLRRLDGRTAIAQRTRELVVAFTADLADAPTGAQLVDVRRAAELTALAEAQRAAALRDPNAVDLGSLVRLEGAADRAVRRLGIKLAERPRATLRERLAQEAACGLAEGT